MMISRIEVLEKFKSRCKRLDLEIARNYGDFILKTDYNGFGDYLKYADTVSLLSDILVEVLND